MSGTAAAGAQSVDALAVPLDHADVEPA